MSATESVSIESVQRHAARLVDLLVDEGPLTGAECCASLDWTRGRFDAAVKVARTVLCPSLDLAIPHPTPSDGWRYQVTSEWQPVEAGAAHALGNIESRLSSVLRDVETVLPNLEPGSRAHRRANFLRKHLAHITTTLEEINNG